MQGNQLSFVKPGDTFVASMQSFHFKRGFTYKVENIYLNQSGQVAIEMKDEYGELVPYQVFNWDMTATTSEKLLEREFAARLKFFWTSKTKWIALQETRYDTKNIYELSFSHFSSEPKAIACIRKFELVPPGIAKDGEICKSPRYFFDKTVNHYICEEADFHSFFFKLQEDKKYDYYRMLIHLTLPSVGIDEGVAIDVNSYIRRANIPYLTDEKIKEWQDNCDDEDQGSGCLVNMEIEEFVNYMARRHFFKDPHFLDKNEHELIKDIVTLFEMAPSSYGPTSIAKLLVAKSKLISEKYEPFVQKYKGVFKQIEVFELTSTIESYLYSKDIFTKKDTYCSGNEWRGQYEYIGSKYINKTEFENFKKSLNI